MKNLLNIFLILASTIFAQNQYSVSGSVKDTLSGEDMIAAVVSVKSIDAAVETNEYGFFSISLPEGKHEISISYSAYNTKTVQVDLQNNITLKVFLSPESKTNVTELETVVITGKKQDDHVDNIKMSTNTIDVNQIKTLPALFGEVDIIKNIQTLPGVQTAGEGTTGYFVRGGGADQNLILLDEAPVYNGSHILGFFSVFNSESIKNAELYKGAIPAQYGGRLSSLLDIRTKDGNMNRYAGNASLGLISGKIGLEGPIKKDKSSFIFSARRSWADAFLKLSSNPETRKNQLYFYDLNAKINYKINDKNRVFLAGYFGRDKLKFNPFDLGWGNATGTLRWNHIFNNKVFSNTSLIFSNFDYALGLLISNFGFNWTSNLKEVGLKQDFNIFASNKIELNTGFQLNYRYFQPGKVTFSGLPGFRDIVLDPYKATEEAVYFNADYKVSPKWFLQYGIRMSMFQQVGSGDINIYANGIARETNLIGKKHYNTLQAVNNNYGIEPRFAARYRINQSTSLKASASRNVQYLHLISNTTVPLPTAVWLPSTTYIRPQFSNQVALGLFKNFKEGMFETSIEGYYKKMYDLTDFKDNAQLFLNPTLETEIRQGNGKSYGAEFFVKKTKGRLNGWISYTLSKATKQIDGVNGGREFRADYDRRHNMNIVGNYELGNNWTLGFAWVYATGRPYTLATGYYMVEGYKMPTYTERNGYVMPAFHRLDVSFTKKWKSVKYPNLEKALNLSVYNLYSRKNPYFVQMEDKLDANGNAIPNEKVVNMYWLFPLIPSISYSVNF
jgi:hypothetical protein